MKRLVVDLDSTITRHNPQLSYADKEADAELVQQLRNYRDLGFTIIIYSARNMRTFENSVGRINAHTLPVMIEWLKRHDIPFDEIHVGKPWCGTDGFYVDDRAVRPAEFLSMSLAEIQTLLDPKQNQFAQPTSNKASTGQEQ